MVAVSRSVRLVPVRMMPPGIVSAMIMPAMMVSQRSMTAVCAVHAVRVTVPRSVRAVHRAHRPHCDDAERSDPEKCLVHRFRLHDLCPLLY